MYLPLASYIGCNYRFNDTEDSRERISMDCFHNLEILRRQSANKQIIYLDNLNWTSLTFSRKILIFIKREPPESANTNIFHIKLYKLEAGTARIRRLKLHWGSLTVKLITKKFNTQFVELVNFRFQKFPIKTSTTPFQTELSSTIELVNDCHCLKIKWLVHNFIYTSSDTHFSAK